MLLLTYSIYRALHCLDENCWSAKFPQTLGPHRWWHQEGRVQGCDLKQIRCQRLRGKQELRDLYYKCSRRQELLLGNLLYRRGLSLSDIRCHLPDCLPQEKEDKARRVSYLID